MSAFTHYPTAPATMVCGNSYTILCNAHDAAESFIDAFTVVRQARNARGTTTDEEQDLLRAALVFASAGLDSMLKQLIRDALADVIGRHEGAELQFKTFVERRLKADESDAYSLLANAITDVDPRRRLLDALVSALTAGSLQSHEEVLKVASFFDIPSGELVDDVRELQSVFRARNQIVHEMDVDFDHVNRNRRSRSKRDMIRMGNEVFKVASRLLGAVDRRCAV